MRTIRFIFVLLLFLSGCDYVALHRIKEPKEKSKFCDTNTISAETLVTYEQVVQVVFEAKCFRCHGSENPRGGVDLSTASLARSWLQDIQLDVETGRMPKGSTPPLTEEEKNLVLTWVAQGGPDKNSLNECSSTPKPVSPPPPSNQEDRTTEQPSDPQVPTPPINSEPENPPPNEENSPPQDPEESRLQEVPEDSLIRYDLVREKILKPHCLDCHSVAGRNRGGLNLESLVNIMAHVVEVEEEVDLEFMPPQSRPPLNSAERLTLLKWIELKTPQ